MLNHLFRRDWWYYMQLDVLLTYFWIAGTSLYALKPSLKLTVSQHAWGVNLLKVSQVVPAWNWSDQKIMSSFFWIMYSREGWKLQVSRENFESSFLISLPKSLAKYAESNSTDHKLIWSGSLELHKQTVHYSWANWAFALLQQTGTSRNVLASFTWLTGPLGRLYSLQSGVERREGCWYN